MLKITAKVGTYNIDRVWEVLYRGIWDISMKAVGLARLRAPVYTGLYRRSLQMRPYIVEPNSRIVVHVGSHVEYADVIEYGRRPGRPPPYTALILWVRRKLGIPREQAPRVAYLVARAIGRRGLPGRYVLNSVWHDIIPDIEHLNVAVQRAITEQ